MHLRYLYGGGGGQDSLPAFHDPFAGGGALPLEAQRLGLEAHASDLNPVAVLINKAMIEIPPKFAGLPPVNPEWRRKPDQQKKLTTWTGAQGLAEDIRYYGKWMRDEAEKRIGHLYPKVRVTAEMCRRRPDLRPYKGRELTVIAWLWARTVPSPNPAFADVEIPLVSSFWLSKKKGKEAWVQPVVKGRNWRFEVRVGRPRDPAVVGKGTAAGKRQGFNCLMSNTAVTYDHIREEAQSGQLGARLMAVVAQGDRERVYVEAIREHEEVARAANPHWRPDVRLEGKCRVNVQHYGMDTFGDIFSARQLVMLTLFSDLVEEAYARLQRDAEAAGMLAGIGTDKDGSQVATYGRAVATYLGLTVGRQANRSSALSFWDNTSQKIQQVFGRQALPMVWDYCESNPFSSATGNWLGQLAWPAKVVECLPTRQTGQSVVHQEDACRQSMSSGKIVSTDPPYYDNIEYADLSDFFYVWLRRALRAQLPDLFMTMAVPKAQELVASPFRHSNKEEAERFFMEGMVEAMRRLAEQSHPDFPVTIYYAFKQAETKDKSGQVRTGWETFLEAVIQAGFSITGTWPVRTELTGNLKKRFAVLASSIVLVCRKRPPDADVISRTDFRNMLATELPAALGPLQAANIAPVDLAQAAIGPGMAIYSRYSTVVYPDGKPLRVRTALQYINQALDEAFEGDFDAETRWATSWFEQHGFKDGAYGVAEVLAKARDTSISKLVSAGVVESGEGRVRLRRPGELPDEWVPTADATLWEKTHHLLRVYAKGGEIEAAKMLDRLGPRDDGPRDLAYSAYLICERNKWIGSAFAYNALVTSWPEIARLSRLKAWVEEPEPQLTLERESDAG